MDKKNLKKLKRADLLELLIGISQDYDSLVRENNRLRKTLSAQRLPKSTKIGSIAEASLQVNGYFEAAQRSADGYLREIKHLRDELARRVEEENQAALGAQLEVRQAQAQASQIIARANAQAEAILADARARANGQQGRPSAAGASRAQSAAAYGSASSARTFEVPPVAVEPLQPAAMMRDGFEQVGRRF